MVMLRPVSLALMILALVAGVFGAGLQRAHAPVAGFAELCIGFEAVQVAVDADGQPVAPHHHCPECIPAPLAALPAPLVLAVASWRLVSVQAPLPVPVVSVPGPANPKHPRAPPFAA